MPFQIILIEAPMYENTPQPYYPRLTDAPQSREIIRFAMYGAFIGTNIKTFSTLNLNSKFASETLTKYPWLCQI